MHDIRTILIVDFMQEDLVAAGQRCCSRGLQAAMEKA